MGCSSEWPFYVSLKTLIQKLVSPKAQIWVECVTRRQKRHIDTQRIEINFFQNYKISFL